MKKFLISALIFFVGFFIIDKALIFLRNYSPTTEVDKRLEWIITGKINSNILIYGSSRGARDVIASQIADSLKTSAYNLSYPGSGVEFHEFLLEQTLKNGNKKPELVILVIDDPTEILPNGLIHFRLDRLYPLVKYPVIRDQLIARDGKNEFLSKFFIVSQLGISNFDITQKHFKNIDTLLADGSMPISYQDSRFNGQYNNTTSYYNIKEEVPTNLKSFMHILQMCKDNNIKLLITSTPNCFKSTIGFNERIKALSKDYGPFYMADTSKPYVKDGSYYFDDVHLRTPGAHIFTSELIDYIRSSGLITPMK
ncbi:MAG: hypothetical protein ABI402_02805 [Ferruginibacter sp.]